MKNRGSLYLVPTFIGDKEYAQNFPKYNKQVAAELQNWVVENVREFRRFLSAIGVPSPYDHLDIVEINKRMQHDDLERMLTKLKNGEDVGLVSDAGCPGVADPGSVMVMKAHEIQSKVIPLIGPSSILLALMASGFNGQQFTFNGYLPVKDVEAVNRLKALEAQSKKDRSTQLFIETPYRNQAMFDRALKALANSTRLCVAYSLQGAKQEITTLTIQEWKSRRFDFEKQPCIFLIMA